jgi:predicted nucleotide-binding protein (sugar kinase/HSP70/actin superfamily)
VVVVTGIGTAHDRLLAAALRARGLPAVVLPPPDEAARALGRALLPRGYGATTYALVGALVRGLRAGVSARVFVTLGGHCAHQGADYRRALAAAGMGEVLVVAPSPAMLLRGLDAGPAAALRARFLPALIDAAALGDLLEFARCAHRPEARSAAAVDAAVDAAAGELATALAAGAPVDPVLRACALALSGVARGAPRDRPRVKLVGEFVAASAPGDAGHALRARIEALGAVVQPPLATEWLLYALWLLGPRTASLRARVLARFARRARALGLAGVVPADAEELAELARAHYPSELRGSAGHLEVGTFLRVERDGLAELVVSVKAFASTASSAVSDAVLHALARRARTGFLALELAGDGDAPAESRLELALDLIALRAAARGAALPAGGPFDAIP